MCRFVFFLLMASSHCVFSARILGIVPTPSYSHQVTFWPIWKALAAKGHDLTLITTNPDPTVTNINQIDIGFTYSVIDDFNFTQTVLETGNNLFKTMDLHIQMGLAAHKVILESEPIQTLLKNESEYFDVVMCEPWDSAILGIVHRFKAPFIGISSLDVPIRVHDCLGNPTHPALYPEMLLPFYEKLTFIERLGSFLYVFFYKYKFSTFYRKEDKLVEQYIGQGYPTLQDLVCSVDMVFVNVNPLFQTVRPLVPAAVTLGGGLHIGPSKPLPKDLQEYLDLAEQGVIYFSLGSSIQSKDLTQETLSVLLRAFKELPYKILWKFEAEELACRPDNVKIVKWLPQQDILRHPNVKVFITQGGLQSIEEAIFTCVPMVVMPFFADQSNNAKKLVNKGIALEVDHFKIDKYSLVRKIREVIENPIYKESITKLSGLMQDQPMTGIEKAVWWTEYVIRNKGAKHLKGPAGELPLYQYFLLDVIVFIFVILSIVGFVLYKILKYFLCSSGCIKEKTD